MTLGGWFYTSDPVIPLGTCPQGRHVAGKTLTERPPPCSGTFIEIVWGLVLFSSFSVFVF